MGAAGPRGDSCGNAGAIPRYSHLGGGALSRVPGAKGRAGAPERAAPAAARRAGRRSTDM